MGNTSEENLNKIESYVNNFLLNDRLVRTNKTFRLFLEIPKVKFENNEKVK